MQHFAPNQFCKSFKNLLFDNMNYCISWCAGGVIYVEITLLRAEWQADIDLHRQGQTTEITPPATELFTIGEALTAI